MNQHYFPQFSKISMGLFKKNPKLKLNNNFCGNFVKIKVGFVKIFPKSRKFSKKIHHEISKNQIYWN
jgi:hypothetical protein